jgi:hypothetical protein
MSIVFEFKGRDYESADEVIAAVEAAGSGSVVKFMMTPNRPGLLPEFVHRSCGLWSYVDGTWKRHSIYDGIGAAYEESRPH